MPPAYAVQWYLSRRGTLEGPYSGPDLHRLYAEGRICPTDKVWAEGELEWRPASCRLTKPARRPWRAAFCLHARDLLARWRLAKA